MTLSHGHENYGALLGRFVVMLAFELNIPIHSGGSTTFRKEARKRGLEADDCYWIQNELRMRGKKKFDIRRDPPPDLALEIDITRSFLDRMAIYASLRIPEVWRFDGKMIKVFHLVAGRRYKVRAGSLAFPFLPMGELLRFLRESDSADETTLLHSFVAWVRKDILPAFQDAKRRSRKSRHGNGKHSGSGD
jgi:Uma2 family endonuclease